MYLQKIKNQALMSNDTKTYLKFLCILAIVVIIISGASFIFPFMSDDEYFVDKYGNIHGNKCPYKEVPWFTTKHSKYDILIEEEQEICDECLFIEKDKLIMIHFANIEELVLCLRINGAPEDYIEKRIKTYYHGD